jgi:ferredoxin-NADP reductase/predicted pyridoxine 5'-phosphate oxidase superfamily flavin-nucleotide-binding protein
MKTKGVMAMVADKSVTTTSPWHRGELAIQASVGVVDKMDDFGRRFVRNHLIEQHRLFYPQLPFLVVGSVDDADNPWATLLAGYPGFLSATDEYTLHVSVRRDESDPATEGLAAGRPIGILGIELHTRRRNRMNGVIKCQDGAGFDISVVQSYGNCPRYIRLRDFSFRREPDLPFMPRIENLASLDEEAKAFIRAADMFFVATYSDEEGGRQVDGSHRGGKPGFVRVDDDDLLTIPDFSGNLFFNTLGNILLNGRAGLLFVDPQTGDFLQMTGRAELMMESPEIEAFQGAERLWTFRAEKIVRRKGVFPLGWQSKEGAESPFSEMTGDWQQAADRVRANQFANSWRPLRVTRIVEESAVIRSLYLAPVDGAGLLTHKAGQHLPIRVELEDGGEPVIRQYTLSVAPSDGVYRISVKRDGSVSQHIHRLKEGAVIEARAPAGSFLVDPLAARPLVLLAAGIGITPMLAMLRHVAFEGSRTLKTRRTWLFYSARSKAEQAFQTELAEIARIGGGAIKVVKVLSDLSGAAAGVDYDEAGRINIGLLKRVLPFDDYDFFLCGPGEFMRETYAALRSLNVADDRIYAEAFGPSTIQRTSAEGKQIADKIAVKSVPVIFTGSAKEARWTPEGGTLLDLAESRGLSPEFSCRSGSCGTCSTKIIQGRVAYKSLPSAPTDENHALICCAYPAIEGNDAVGGLQLDL